PVVLLDGDDGTVRLLQHVRFFPRDDGVFLSSRPMRVTSDRRPTGHDRSCRLANIPPPPQPRRAEIRRPRSALMHVFDLNKEQEWNPKHHVEKILGKVADGDVTVACWEPGQISPYHCHPHATEIYFCYEGGGRMRTPTRTIDVVPGSFVVHPPGELHEYI